MSFIQSWTAVDWVQAAAGVGVAALGAILLWRGRFHRQPNAAGGTSRPLGATIPILGAVSEATRLVIAVCLLALGYHLVVWTLPPDATPVQLPRRHWWVLVGVVVMLPLLSRGLDRMGAPPPSGP